MLKIDSFFLTFPLIILENPLRERKEYCYEYIFSYANDGPHVSFLVNFLSILTSFVLDHT